MDFSRDIRPKPETPKAERQMKIWISVKANSSYTIKKKKGGEKNLPDEAIIANAYDDFFLCMYKFKIRKTNPGASRRRCLV